MSTPESRRRHARIVTSAVNRELSGAIGQLEELARLTMTSEFNAATLELDRIRTRLSAIAEEVK